MLKNSVRIIGGQWRGRQIGFNAQSAIRPTPDRVRETLFNWLMNDIHGARCLDLFAGSGILGLEALSRGAGFVLSIERDRETVKQMKQAATLLGLSDALWCISQHDALSWLAHSSNNTAQAKPFDLIFLDPPYPANLWKPCLLAIQQQHLLRSDGIIYLESDRSLTEEINATGYTVHREKKSGSVYAYLAIANT